MKMRTIAIHFLWVLFSKAMSTSAVSLTFQAPGALRLSMRVFFFFFFYV